MLYRNLEKGSWLRLAKEVIVNQEDKLELEVFK
jgi:hypothetical protein